MAITLKDINDAMMDSLKIQAMKQAKYEEAGIAELKKAFEKSGAPSWDQYVNAPAQPTCGPNQAPLQVQSSYKKGWKPTSLKQLYCPSEADIKMFNLKKPEVKVQGGMIQAPLSYEPMQDVPKQQDKTEPYKYYWLGWDKVAVMNPTKTVIITNIEPTEPQP